MAGVAILVAFYSESVLVGLLGVAIMFASAGRLRAQPASHGQGRLARPHPFARTMTSPSGAGGGIEHAVHGARDWFRTRLFRRDS